MGLGVDMNRTPIIFLAALGVASVSNAQTATGASAPQTVSLGGTTQYDLFNDVSAGANPGRGSFPGSGAWSAPIESNVGGDAQLKKVSNGTGGGPYAASASIYYGGFSATPNTNGGTLAVTDTSPVANLKTVVFQVQIGEAWTYDFFNHTAPVLSYNGGTQNLVATWDRNAVQEFVGTVTMPTGEEPIYKNLWAYQWDLSGIGTAITDISLSFTGVQHAQLYGLQLNQSDQVYNSATGPVAAPVPEPASMAAIAIGGLGLLRRRRNKKA